MMEMYVVVTRYDKGKRAIVHAYGPYATRSAATTEKKRMRRQTEEWYGTEDGLTVSVCKVLE